LISSNKDNTINNNNQLISLPTVIPKCTVTKSMTMNLIEWAYLDQFNYISHHAISDSEYGNDCRERY